MLYANYISVKLEKKKCIWELRRQFWKGNGFWREEGKKRSKIETAFREKRNPEEFLSL